MNHFIPTWDWFVGTEKGKKLLADNKAQEWLIMAAFKCGMDAVQRDFNVTPDEQLFRHYIEGKWQRQIPLSKS